MMKKILLMALCLITLMSCSSKGDGKQFFVESIPVGVQQAYKVKRDRFNRRFNEEEERIVKPSVFYSTVYHSTLDCPAIKSGVSAVEPNSIYGEPSICAKCMDMKLLKKLKRK